MIKVDYVIAEQHLETFLDCMREWRRIQSRAGARNWTLQRDLRTSTIWTETFRTPTWTAYLRLDDRLTADKDSSERLAALHGGDLPPEPSFRSKDQLAWFVAAANR